MASADRIRRVSSAKENMYTPHDWVIREHHPRKVLDSRVKRCGKPRNERGGVQ